MTGALITIGILIIFWCGRYSGIKYQKKQTYIPEEKELDDWAVIWADKYGAFWEVGEKKTRHICSYIIQYSPSQERYRLISEGYKPKEHSSYQDALLELAKFNSSLLRIKSIK